MYMKKFDAEKIYFDKLMEWLYSRTSLKTEYESSMAVVYCYSFVVGLNSE